MIEVRELSFAYGQSPVLSGLSFTIGEGGLTALLDREGKPVISSLPVQEEK